MKVYQECLSFKISILNRNAHLTDRYFILCHVLRCPQEMGEWSKKFIQPLPQSDSLFDRSLVMNHFLTLLRIVLEPINCECTFSYLACEMRKFKGKNIIRSKFTAVGRINLKISPHRAAC
uniref:Uncharacterized protein n=1 Tax=Romanomermis culicivorax TaxID=13658 RepID=A0A915I3L4_ROMCU